MHPVLRHDPRRLLARGTHAGYEYLVLNSGMGFRNGYVLAPVGHPWEGLKYQAIEDKAECHGGLTYSGADDEGRGTYFGFDTGHGGDGRDRRLRWDSADVKRMFAADHWKMFGQRARSTAYVVAECRSLCEQLLVASGRTDDLALFVRAVRQAPRDAAPRLVFADWLDENGQAEWAARLRAEAKGLLSPVSNG